MRISIRYKILGVVGFLLIAAVCFYTLLASSIFRQEKIALLYDINHSIAVNTASQVGAELTQIGDQLKIFVLANVLSDRTDLKLPASFLQEAHVIGAQLFKKAPKDLVGNNTLFVETKMGGGLPSTGLAQAEILPRLKEADGGNYAFWSSTSGESPRFFLASKVEMRLATETEIYIAVAELEGKQIFSALQSANLFRSYLVKRNGEVLLQCDRRAIASAPPLKDHPLLTLGAGKGAATSGVLSFDFGGESWYGAYAPVGIGDLLFLSQASRHEVTAALETLVKRSVLFGLIVITATFIASILFSKSLTKNLRLLTEGARRIEKGDLDSQIQIKSRDEVAELASSFNAMVVALKSSREAIEKYNRELEDKVAERTKQLHETNAAIKEVQEKLLQTTQLAAMGEVAGRTAHEVLNPLTAIISRVERSRDAVGVGAEPTPPGQLNDILAAWESDYKKGGIQTLAEALQTPSTIHANLSLFEEDLDNLKKLSHFWQTQTATVAQDLKFVQEQAQRIHRIVDKMRELVRSSVKAEVACGEAVKEAVATMSDFLAKHGVTLHTDFKAKDDYASLNRDELVQIITNLVRNSYQSIKTQIAQRPRHKGLIAVRTASGNGVMTVEIVDNGVGVPPDKKDVIFEGGFTTKGPSEGTGLGLAICRRYARAFSGEVELAFSESEGRGTCFRITIPLLASLAAPPTSAAPKDSKWPAAAKA